MDKWLIFDAMGVIYEAGDDTRDLLIPYISSKVPEFDEEYIYELCRKASFGIITSKEFWNLLGFENWMEVTEDYLDNFLTLDKDFIKTAELLSKKYNLAMLSNDVGEWSKYLRRKFDIDKYFKKIVISSEVGYRKPDKKIYEILLEQINVPAKNCIFIDDRVKNLIISSELGIKSIHFNRNKVDSEGFVNVYGFSEIVNMLI